MPMNYVKSIRGTHEECVSNLEMYEKKRSRNVLLEATTRGKFL